MVMDQEPFVVMTGKPKEAGAAAVLVAMALAASSAISSGSGVLRGCASEKQLGKNAEQTRPNPVQWCTFLELCHIVLPHVPLGDLRLDDVSVKNIANATPDRGCWKYS